MLRRLGYACLCVSLPNSSPRGTVLRNATPDRLRALIEENLDRLARVLEFNVAHRIRLFRISSDLIPFGSHPVNQVPWWEEFGPRLAELGAYIRTHDLRVSVHPGQHTVLSAVNEAVAIASLRDLEYHGRLLDALGVDLRSKIVVHGGGAYGDKSAALSRWARRADQLPAGVRARLVIENDERKFGAEDILTLSGLVGLPVVFDLLHHRAYAGPGDRDLSGLLRRVFATWRPERDGPPKVHLSSQAPGKRLGAHAELVAPGDLAALLAAAPPEIDFDCMLEAKSKELALFHLRQELALAA